MTELLEGLIGVDGAVPTPQATDDGVELDVELDPGWLVWDSLSGGYVAAQMLLAMDHVSTAESQPSTMNIQFARRVKPGPATFHVHVTYTSRSGLQFIGVSLTQAGKIAATGTAVFVPSERQDPIDDSSEKALPEPDQWVPNIELHGGQHFFAFEERFQRYDVNWDQFVEDCTNGGSAAHSVWCRFPGSTDQVSTSLARCVVMADIFPWFATLRLGPDISAKYVPRTLGLTLTFRAVTEMPSADLFLETEAPATDASLVTAAVRIYQRDGTLLAQGLQTNAIMPLPAGYADVSKNEDASRWTA